MRVFTQLMMRRFHSAVNYMNLDVVGSPTINNGVVSGFSDSKYLEIPNFPTYTQDDRVEFVFNFTFDSSFVNSIIIGGAGAIIVPLVESNNKIKYYSNILGNATGTNTLIANQNYFFKLICDTNSYKAYISTDGRTWTLDASKSFSDTFSKSGVLTVGRNPSVSGQYLRGSIDINNSYIKIGSTKYNFQFTMPLTKVGSPTITDGVVSGFSSSDYLNAYFGNAFNFDNDFEMNCDFTTGETIPSLAPLLIGSSATQGGFRILSSKVTFSCRISGVSTNYALSLNQTLSANTNYVVNVKRVGDSIALKLYANNVLLEEKTDNLENILFDWTGIKNIRIGYTSSNGAFDGSVNIPNCYVVESGTKYILTLP